MGYFARSLPPAEIARAKALPLMRADGSAQPAASEPNEMRQAWTDAVDAWVDAWFTNAMVSDRDLASILMVSATAARRKRKPGEQSKFTLADLGLLPDQHYHRFVADYGDLRRNRTR